MKYPPLWLAEKIESTSWGKLFAGHLARRFRCYEMVESIITALAVFIVLQAFVVQAYEIPSGSMKDTLLVGDRILVSKFYYWCSEPEHGDVVVFQVPDVLLKKDPDKRYYIKRLIGKPNDTVEIKNNSVFVNGDRLGTKVGKEHSLFFMSNKYYNRCEYKVFHKKQVPSDQYFMFGDNSDMSYDSRAWGGVPTKNAIGKAVFRFWPLSRFGLIRDEINTRYGN
jgi:signal peptidase I